MMPTRLVLIAIVLTVFAGSYLAKGHLRNPPRDEVGAGLATERIVSLAPSITETLFALELGDRIVGVTRYCDYPPEARKKAKVGGYHDRNFEAIVALRPELVILLAEDGPTTAAFRKLGLKTLAVCHRNVEGILASISTIGRACGAEANALRIAADLEARLRRIKEKTVGLRRPRVLIVIERTVGTGRLEDVYAAGSDGFFDKIVALAGGRNAYPPGPVRFPVVSTESILSMDPQVILDMTAGLALERQDTRTLLADWQQVGQVEAVKSGRIHAVDQDYAFVPGPRFILLVEDLARLVHPEIDWQ